MTVILTDSMLEDLEFIGNCQKGYGQMLARGIGDVQEALRDWYNISQQFLEGEITVDEWAEQNQEIQMSYVETAMGSGISMEDLLRPFMVRRTSFENFKSTVCHRVMEMGDVEFMMDLLDSNAIRTYYDRHWYPESLYLLAMLDYLSRLHNLPQCSDYDDLRQCKLEKTVYPASVMAMSLAAGNDEALKQAEREAIPEFMRFNIVESDVRNVI